MKRGFLSELEFVYDNAIPFDVPKSAIENLKRTITQDDKDFRLVLLKDIPYFHYLYSKEKDQRWLDIAQTLGVAASNLKKRLST